MSLPTAGALLALTFALCALHAPDALARGPFVVVVDPGHGGAQDGALGSNGALEKNVCLQIAKKLRAQLTAQEGVKVFMTREADVDVHLSDRVAWANRKSPDLFISIHANSMPTRRLRERTSGVETYFLSASASGTEAASTADRENAEGPAQPEGPKSDTLAFILADLQRAESHADSSRLAYAVHARLIDAVDATDRGVQQAPFYVLNGLTSPAILVEVGYISHPTEGKLLGNKAYQEKLAKAIAEGVKEFRAQISGRDVEITAEAPTP